MQMTHWTMRSATAAVLETALDGFSALPAAGTATPRLPGIAAFDALGDHVVCTSSRAVAPIYEVRPVPTPMSSR